MFSLFRKALTALFVVSLIAGCGRSDDVFRIGVMAGPEADLMRKAVEVAESRSNGEFKFEVIEFSDYISPNIALNDGSIDMNAFQHEPYLNQMINDRGLSLVKVGTTFVYPIGGYSNEVESLAQLKDGDVISIPNDPTNEARALMILHKAGIIELDDVNNLVATPSNIIVNPLNLRFVELEAAQLPRSLEDVTVAFINSTYSVPSGLIPTRDALVVEGADSPYVNLMVTRMDNQSDPRVDLVVAGYQSDTVKELAEELFKGGAIASW
ncbi:MAG: MetQ/NlpA family ABC transporter substrate-binding protein [Gammaproteobacteria bacterium]|nr:MetQ/NlpA family ABC transporter substrate-binding protein [Gammaproteobacteria bacterium]